MRRCMHDVVLPRTLTARRTRLPPCGRRFLGALGDRGWLSLKRDGCETPRAEKAARYGSSSSSDGTAAEKRRGRLRGCEGGAKSGVDVVGAPDASFGVLARSLTPSVRAAIAEPAWRGDGGGGGDDRESVSKVRWELSISINTRSVGLDAVFAALRRARGCRVGRQAAGLAPASRCGDRCCRSPSRLLSRLNWYRRVFLLALAVSRVPHPTSPLSLTWRPVTAASSSADIAPSLPLGLFQERNPCSCSRLPYALSRSLPLTCSSLQ